MDYSDKLKELNVTEENENVIGTVRDIQNLFLFMIKRDIDDTELDIEDLLSNIELNTELIKNLYKVGFSYETKIRVWFNPMGAYEFELYEEE